MFFFIGHKEKAVTKEVGKANLNVLNLNKKLLYEMVNSGASDLHLTAGVQPCVRLDGSIYRMYQYDRLTSDKIQQIVYSVLKDKQKKEFEQNNELDFSFGLPGLSRFRANVFKQRGNIACAIRAIPFKKLSFSELGLSSAIEDFVKLPRGLILVTGPTGCGKSTTLASMIDYINKTRPCHIITVEDPLEYTYSHHTAIVNQREVGSDTVSFATALKYVLREDPDVIMVGEMRDTETMRASLTAAETGHLVFSTLHTNSAIESINRIIDSFPAHQQSQIRTQLAFVLQGVMTQQLIPKAHGPGRVLVAEILVPTTAIRSMIREDKLHQIYAAVQTGKQYKMQTMNEALTVAVKKGIISSKEAKNRSMNKIELKNLYKHYGLVY